MEALGYKRDHRPLNTKFNRNTLKNLWASVKFQELSITENGDLNDKSW